MRTRRRGTTVLRVCLWVAGIVVSFALLGATVAAIGGERGTGSETTSGALTVYGKDLKNCDGPTGIEGISPDTPVVVKDNKGNELVRGPLGTGVFYAKQGACQFRFTLTIPGGHDFYVISVGDHAATKYTWERLALPCAIDLNVGAVPVSAAAVVQCVSSPTTTTTRGTPSPTTAGDVEPPPTPPEYSTTTRDRSRDLAVAVKYPSALRNAAHRAQLANATPAQAVALYRGWKQASSNAMVSALNAARSAEAAGNEAAVVAACSKIADNLQNWAMGYASAPNAATSRDADALIAGLAALTVSCTEAPILEPDFSDALTSIYAARDQLTHDLDSYSATSPPTSTPPAASNPSTP